MFLRANFFQRSLTLGVVVLLGGCAALRPQEFGGKTPNQRTIFSGRMAITVDSSPPKSLSTAFSITGNAVEGNMQLLSPFGTELGSIYWKPGFASWRSGSKTAAYDSMAELTKEVAGAALPMQCFFEWLKNKTCTAVGWQESVAPLDSVKIIARRTEPAPSVTLIVIRD